MNPSINNILIPVGQSLNTQRAVAEAIELAKPWQTTIHLVGLMRSWNPFLIVHPASAFRRMLNNDLDSYVKALLNLMHWKSLIETSCSGVVVKIHLKNGFSWQHLIQQTAQRVGTGTIIVACGPRRKWFSFRNFLSIHLLARKTGYNILSITTNKAAGFTKNGEMLPRTLKRTIAGNSERPAVFSIPSIYHSLSHN